VREAHSLAAQSGAVDDRQRSRWLAAQIDGMAATAERLAGDTVTYRDEVRRCYGFELAAVSEDTFEEARRDLGRLLPGSGDLRERYEAWVRSVEIPNDALTAALDAVEDEVRRRTQSLYGLPRGESARLDFVTNEPWSGFNYYLGGLESRIAVNVDFPTRATFVAPLLTHEIYPGHHTEHSWKESLLVRGRGYLEESISMISTPQCLIAEGIASYALQALGPEAEPTCEAILRAQGKGYDVEVAQGVRAALRKLAGVGDNAALMLYEKGQNIDAVHAYWRRWSLESDERLQRSISFLTHPVWRAYGVVYEAAHRLVETWTAGDPKRFERLLTEQLTPADLTTAATPSPDRRA
jgi:hypothetical protein